MRRRALRRVCLGLCACTLLGWTHSARGDASPGSLEALLNTPISAASKYEQTIDDAPASVTILTSEDIERYGWRTLAEALQTVRGLYISNDRNYAYLGARGFARPTDYNNRVLLLINGHVSNEDFYNSASLGPSLGINLDAVERIEVVQGPGSALYGTGAVFGVIDIITKTADAVDGLRVSAEGGSFGRKGISGIYGGKIGGDVELTLSGLWNDVDGQDIYYAEYDDPETNDGIARDLDWDRVGGIHGALRAGDFRLEARFASRETGVPTGAFETTFNDSHSSTLDETGFVELSYSNEPGAHTAVMARGYSDYYHYLGVYPYEGESPFFEENDSLWGGAELQLQWDPVEYNRLVVGVEAQRHSTVHYDSRQDDIHYVEGRFPFTLMSAYGQNTYQPLANLSLTVGFRGDVYSGDADSLSPRVAVIYDPLKSSTVKLLYGEAFRVPSRYERHYEHAPSFKTNPLLEPERFRTAEAVWEQRMGAGLFGIVSAYRYEMRNLIDSTVDPEDDLGIYRNVGEVDAHGMEAELRAQVGQRGRAYVSYAYQRAEDGESSLRLTNSPAHVARGGVVARVLPQLYGAAAVVIESGRATVQDTKTDPFLVLNLSLSTTELFGETRAALHVRNVLDESYAYPGGIEHLQPAIRQDGRDITLTVDRRF